jgi:hypothetical protein
MVPFFLLIFLAIFRLHSCSSRVEDFANRPPAGREILRTYPTTLQNRRTQKEKLLGTFCIALAANGNRSRTEANHQCAFSREAWGPRITRSLNTRRELLRPDYESGSVCFFDLARLPELRQAIAITVNSIGGLSRPKKPI